MKEKYKNLNIQGAVEKNNTEMNRTGRLAEF
jgi:hypothetical protein